MYIYSITYTSMAKTNLEKTPPKGEIKFAITLSDDQKAAKALIMQTPFNFILGSAGSGKTLLAVQVALYMQMKRLTNKIVITRPTISTEDNGFIPGDDMEKMAPWLVPIMDNINKTYKHPEFIEKLKEKKDLEIIPLTYFRGRTFENAVCIIDEFQNLTKAQLQMCIGRLGKNSIMIFTGDPHQIDLKYKSDSAYFALDKIQESQYVNITTLTGNHRHEALVEVLKLLNNE